MKLPAASALIFAPALGLAFPVESVAAFAPAQLADLKTFFHGEPAAPLKAPRPKITATVSTADGVEADAIQLRDGKRMLPRLAADFAMGPMPDGLEAPTAFAQGINRIAGPTTIVVCALEKKNGERTAQVEFRYPSQTRRKIMTFTADGKLQSTDLFTVKIESHGHF